MRVVPVRVLDVAVLDGFWHAVHGGIGDEGGFADVLSGPGVPPDELQCDAEALMNAMQRRDFQAWQVEAFAEHIDAGDNPMRTAADAGKATRVLPGVRLWIGSGLRSA